MIMEPSSLTLLFEENPFVLELALLMCVPLQDIIVLLFGGELGGVCFDKQFPRVQVTSLVMTFSMKYL